MSKNAILLAEFTAYCTAHPDFRFWQALGNWCRKRRVVDEFMSKPQPKDHLGFLEPSCPVMAGYSWTPTTGLYFESKDGR